MSSGCARSLLIRQHISLSRRAASTRAAAAASLAGQDYWRESESSFYGVGVAVAAAVAASAAACKYTYQREKEMAQCESPIQLQRSKRAPAQKLLAGGAARNVMLHRMRSLRARDLSEKYRVDWRTVLGEGAYGSVHPARHSATGEKVALKKMRKRYTDTSSFRTETDALLRIYDNGGHPNVAGLRDMYEDYSHFYLVMDLVNGGELFEHLIQYGAYSEADAARLVQEVASALAFLHGVGVVHCDLKPENLLLCSKKKSDGTIKLIDFGCALVSHDNYEDDIFIGDDDEEDWLDPTAPGLGSSSKSKAMLGSGSHIISVSGGQIPSTGTTAYWAPERFQHDANGNKIMPDSACDCWSLGVILYIMVSVDAYICTKYADISINDCTEGQCIVFLQGFGIFNPFVADGGSSV